MNEKQEKQGTKKCPWCGSTKFVSRETAVVELFESAGSVRTEVVERSIGRELHSVGCSRDMTDVELKSDPDKMPHMRRSDG